MEQPSYKLRCERMSFDIENFCGCTLPDGTSFSPEEMGRVHRIYYRAILKEKFGTVRRLEKNYGFSIIWLNSVMSKIIKENEIYGIPPNKLIEEFHDRGFRKKYWSPND